MSFIENSKHDNSIFCWDRWEGTAAYSKFKSEFRAKDIEVFEGLHGRNLLRNFYDLHGVVRNRGIRVIHSYHTGGHILGAIITVSHRNLRLVVSFEGAGRTRSRLLKTLEACSYNQASVLISISNYVRNQRVGTLPNASRDRDIVIYNGAAKREATMQQVKNGAQLNLLNVAGLNRIKNQAVLINAMEVIARKRQDVHLDLVGEGPDSERLRSMVGHKNLQDCVRILGYREDVGDFLSRCDIYVHAAKGEGFGIAVVEAMLARKPIVVASSGALPELILDQNSGILADPDDPTDWAAKIEFLLDNPSIGARMASNAYDRASKLFGLDTYVKNVDELYDSLFP